MLGVLGLELAKALRSEDARLDLVAGCLLRKEVTMLEAARFSASPEELADCLFDVMPSTLHAAYAAVGA